MNDIVRIFLVIAVMFLSFRLGEEYQRRVVLGKLINDVEQGLQQILKSFMGSSDEAPTPNETIGE